ncbi:MAG: sigma-70 family RNA polymerase sigma factor [Acidobacteriota bacterium]
MSPSTPRDITRLLSDLSSGDQRAADRLAPTLYRELRAIAGRVFRAQPAGHTLQPTALVHEVWFRLADQPGMPETGRTHFLNLAAQAMRQILTDHARRRRAARRGGEWQRVSLGHVEYESSTREVDVVDLDDALSALGEIDERQARVVEMRFLAGMTIEETAEALGVSPRTVQLDWRMARAWLRRRLGGGAVS